MPLTDAQEKEIVFDNLFNEYFIPLCVFCQYKFRFDIDEAKDVVHSAFLKIWESDLTFSSELSSKTYLYKVVTNICLDMLRHEKIKKQHHQYFQKNLTELDLAEENKMTELKEMQNDIEDALAEMPDKTLGYVFPVSIAQKLKANNLRIYLSSNNPITITKNKSFNPDVSNSGDPLSPGHDRNNYPLPRNIMLGLNVTF